MHNTDSFISYRRSASMHLARNIFTELHRRNINAFLDVENIDATRFDTFILNQIAARPNYVLVLSKGALLRCTEPGDWLLRELQHAVNLNRNIIPVWDVGFDWEAEKTYLPDALHFIGLRNAVNFSHSYYRGSMDLIAKFIRNPQDHDDINIVPPPQDEIEEAKQVIREALAIRFDDEMIVETIGEYYRLKPDAQNSTDWEALLDLWGQIRANGTLPSFFQFDDEEKILREALEKRRQIEAEIHKKLMYETQREKDYDFIRRLSGNVHIPRDRVLELLEKFWKSYPQDNPKYDPDDLSGERAETERLSHERAEAERLAREKAEAERLAREKAEAEYLAREKAEAEYLARERAKADQTAREKARSNPVPIESLLPPPFAKVKISRGKGIMQADGGITLTMPTETYWMSKYPITNAQYVKFIEAGGYDTQRWWTYMGWEIRQNENWTQPRYWQDTVYNGMEQPVVGISWYEAVAFCLWLSEVTSENATLPTEAQWQYAAQGEDGRQYPWGNKWDLTHCNNHKNDESSGLFSLFKPKLPDGHGERTTPVTAYQGKGDSPFGVVDMVGNVWEWCLTDYDDRTDDLNSAASRRLLRGGSWNLSGDFAQATYHVGANPNYGLNYFGFRVVFLLPPSRDH